MIDKLHEDLAESPSRIFTSFDSFLVVLASQDESTYRPPPENDADAIFARALAQAKLRRSQDRPATAPPAVYVQKSREDSDEVDSSHFSTGPWLHRAESRNLCIAGGPFMNEDSPEANSGDNSEGGWSFG